MQTVILPALAQPNLLWFNSNKQLNFYFSKDMHLQQLNYSTFSLSAITILCLSNRVNVCLSCKRHNPHGYSH